MAFEGPLEDRIAISELVIAYGDAVCRRHADDWSSLWAKDAIWLMPEIPGMERIEGRESIRATWIEAMKSYPFQVNRPTLSNVRIDGDRAEGEVYTSELVKDVEGVAAHWTNRYRDTYIKIDGKWHFNSRTLEILHIGAA